MVSRSGLFLLALLLALFSALDNGQRYIACAR